MSLWTSQEAVRATAGTSPAQWRASGVSIDTRTLEKGDLFVALHGPNFDGHDFLAQAFAKGAAAAMIDGGDADGPALTVADTQSGLEDLGREARRRSGAAVIAVTGSVGKTGSKEALKFVLSRQGVTSASAGSLNNHWGVPLSLSRMPRDAAFGVFELGMNHPGEITPLTKMVRPHVALITTVEAVHSEFFDSVEDIADAKAEIFAGVEPGGAAVLNRDNRYFHRLAAAARGHGIERIVPFGSDDEADFRVLDVADDTAGTVIDADLGGTVLRYRLAVPGRHWVLNSLGVLAAVAAAGGDVAEAAASLADLRAPKGRGRSHTVTMAGGPLTVIDESYNASPVSMGAAIEVLGRAVPGPGGRRIAVLGDMLELGEEAPELHERLAAPLAEENIDLVFTAGRHMARLARALDPGMLGGHADNSERLEAMVLEAVAPGDVVVVKGSAGSRTGRIVEALLALETTAAPRQRAVNGG